MAVKVECAECGEESTLGQPSDAWKCPNCGTTNVYDEPQETNPPSRAAEIAALKAEAARLEEEEQK